MVPDTNVLVSAVLQPHGTTGRILEAWRDGALEFVVCPALLRELATVLRRPALRRHISGDDADRLSALIRRQGELRADPVFEPGLTRDPRDDFIVALAAATRADCIVSGDADLRTLTGTAPQVLSPKALLQKLGQPPG